MTQLSTFEIALQSAETQLLRNLSKNNGAFQSGRPIEDICRNLALLVGGRRIHSLRSVYTAPKSAPKVVDHRSEEIVFLKSINEFFKPQKCVFNATEVSEEEKRYLNARGIDAEAADGVLEASTDDFAEDEVEICWVTFCNPLLLNELLRKRWSNLSKTVFIGSVITFSRYGLSREMHPLFSHYLDTTRYKIYALISRSAGEQPQPPNKKHCILPFYTKKTDSEDALLREMTEFAHIDANIRKIQKDLDHTGMTSSFVSNLQKLLDGRTLKRIRIIGLGNFATCFQTSSTLIAPLAQLAMNLAVQKHFNASMTAQEPRATPFEMAYLNSLGIETPEADDLLTPEDGLAENEVTLFFMIGCFAELKNAVCWANRKAMRSIIIVGGGISAKSKRPRCCANCEASERRINKSLNSFQEEANEIPFPQDRKLPYNFVGQSIMSYPRNTLPVSDEKPTDPDFSGRNCLKAKRK